MAAEEQDEITPTSDTSGNNEQGATTDSGPNIYDRLEKYIISQIDNSKTETQEEREKREKREKQISFLSGLADGLGSFHTAFSQARGEKPMDMPNMSAKAKERFEKAKAEREKNDNRAYTYLTSLANLHNTNRTLSLREMAETRLQLKDETARAKQEWAQQYQQGLLDVKQELANIKAQEVENKRLYNEGKISVEKCNAKARELQSRANYLNALTKSGGYTEDTTITRDMFGRETGRSKTHTPNTPSGNLNWGEDGGDGDTDW